VLLSRRLINALTGESRDVLVELMRSLGHVERLLADLRAGALPLRLQAASELAWFDQPEVRQALHHALDDRFYGVRLVAANSLIALGKLDSAREIVRCLTEDVDPLPLSLRPLFRQLATIDPKLMAGLADDAREPLAVLAIDAMAAAHQGIDFEQLCRIAIEHTGKNARAAALRTLGLLGADADERYRMLPEAGAQSPPGPLRSDDALRAVVARSVRRGLADRDWEVRTQAVIATQRLGLTEVIPRLLAMQSDPQWWVRFRSTQALAALQGRARSGQAPVVIPLELLEAKRLESVT
jgi:HEAT repeat protein